MAILRRRRSDWMKNARALRDRSRTRPKPRYAILIATLALGISIVSWVTSYYLMLQN